MNEEDIKKRILAERMTSDIQQKQAEDTLKKMSSHILEPNAKERLSNLRLVKPEIAMQLELYLTQLFQAGQIREKITDDQLVSILNSLTEKRDIKIRRK